MQRRRFEERFCFSSACILKAPFLLRLSTTRKRREAVTEKAGGGEDSSERQPCYSTGPGGAGRKGGEINPSANKQRSGKKGEGEGEKAVVRTNGKVSLSPPVPPPPSTLHAMASTELTAEEGEGRFSTIPALTKGAGQGVPFRLGSLR